MATPENISYLLYVDDDAIPLEASMTLGNHLDNEIMVPGEDVADFHLRVEITDRGPVFVPLGQATLSINGVETDQPVRATIGDVLGVGQTTIQIGFEVEQDQGELNWFVVDENGQEFPVIGEVAIGRADGTDITLADAHISRFHARLIERSGFVWIQDLGSANGTKINGERVQGGVRLFHGDQLSFDRFEFQLVARGGDVTPLLKFDEPLRGTTETLPNVSQSPSSAKRVSKTETALVGPCLVRGSEEGHGPREVYPLAVGENIIGADANCDVQLTSPGVDGRHVRIVVSVDGIRLTNISSPDKTLVNGNEVDSILLQHGDVVTISGQTLNVQIPNDVPSSRSHGVDFFRAHSIWVYATIAALFTLFMLLLLT